MERHPTVEESPGQIDCLERAKELTAGLGRVPNSFSMAVRLLIIDQARHGGVLRPVTKYQISRLFRSASFRAMLYYASKFIKGDQLKHSKNLRTGGLMSLYQPGELAVLIAVHFLFRRFKKLCKPELFDRVYDDLRIDSQIGAALGHVIPAIGISSGLIAGTVQPLMLAFFAMAQPKLFVEYMRARKRKRIFDLSIERRCMGCSTLELAPMLLSSAGLGNDISNGVYAGLHPERTLAGLGTGTMGYGIRMARLWIDAIAAGKVQPEIEIHGDYYPLEEQREKFDVQVYSVKGGLTHWMLRTGSDLGPEKTPELFQEQPPTPPELEIPDELKDVFSLEEVSDMDEWSFGELIDQIDREHAGEAMIGDTAFSTKEFEQLGED
jgi:hypothetical protein